MLFLLQSGGELYPLTTPLSELGDFGLGIGLYFSSRVAMALMFGFIGFLNIFTIMGSSYVYASTL
jgi:hypothetical protein